MIRRIDGTSFIGILIDDGNDNGNDNGNGNGNEYMMYGKYLPWLK